MIYELGHDDQGRLEKVYLADRSNVQARNDLMVAYQPMVLYYAKRYMGLCPWLYAEYAGPRELGNSCQIRLMEAIARFDPARGVKLSTYLIGSVKNRLKDIQIEVSRMIARKKRVLNKCAKPEAYFDNNAEVWNDLPDILSPEQLQVVDMRFQQGLQMKEIDAARGKNRGCSHCTLQWAGKRIRNALLEKTRCSCASPCG